MSDAALFVIVTVVAAWVMVATSMPEYRQGETLTFLEQPR